MQRKLTGVPPLTFVSNGENLVDYRIYGASGGVGDRTRNLIDEKAIGTIVPNPQTPDVLRTGQILNNLFNDTYFLSFRSASNRSTIKYVRFRSGTRIDTVGFEVLGTSIIDMSSADELRWWFNLGEPIANYKNIQLVAGSIGYDYEPYGYKIPVVCGGTTTNIYLDEPLEESESVSLSDTGVSIPTINGSNTLSVNTTVQPSSVYVKYATNERSVPARTYLQGVEKMDNWAIYNYINREGSGALKNESTVTSTTVEVRNTIQVTGAASGGTGSYQYAFYHKRSNAENWTTKSDYGAATTVEFSPYYVGTYKFKVNVKDSKGTIKSKIFNINVTAAVSTTSNMPSLDKLSFDDTDELTIENDFNIADLTVEDNTPEEV